MLFLYEKCEDAVQVSYFRCVGSWVNRSHGTFVIVALFALFFLENSEIRSHDEKNGDVCNRSKESYLTPENVTKP